MIMLSRYIFLMILKKKQVGTYTIYAYLSTYTFFISRRIQYYLCIGILYVS